MIRRALDWIGSARRENADITSDALRIGQLEAANKALKADLKTARDEAARAIVTAAIAQGKCERAQDQLRAILGSKEYTTGVKRLAAIAKYRRDRA